MSYYTQLTSEEKHWLLEHARERYVAGETLDQLVASLPVSKATLYRAQVEQGWRRKDQEALAAGADPLPKPEWLLKYESELVRVPHGMDRAYVNRPDRLSELKEQAEALPESLDITDMAHAAKKAGELAARYQLIGEVKMADAQARLAERFVRLAEGMEGLVKPVQEEAEPEVEGESVESMRQFLFNRLEEVVGVEYMRAFYAEYVLTNEGEDLSDEAIKRVEEAVQGIERKKNDEESEHAPDAYTGAPRYGDIVN